MASLDDPVPEEADECAIPNFNQLAYSEYQDFSKTALKRQRYDRQEIDLSRNLFQPKFIKLVVRFSSFKRISIIFRPMHRQGESGGGDPPIVPC